MKLVTAVLALSLGAIAAQVGVMTFNHVEQMGYDRGVKSNPQTPCYPFVKAAEEAAGERAVAALNFVGNEAYKHGVLDTIVQLKAYIADSCATAQEVEVDGVTYTCLKQGEM